MPESASKEIIQKTTARHSRNNSISASLSTSPTDKSPTFAVHQWFSNILNPNPNPNFNPNSNPHPPTQSQPLPLPPKASKTPRRSRFQQNQEPLPILYRDPSPTSKELQDPLLSPPRNLVESAHRRSISSSTCSLDAAVPVPRRHSVSVCSNLSPAAADEAEQINSFLRRQRAEIERISNGEVSAKAKIVLSGSAATASSTSSVVAAICYAWLLENRVKEEGTVVVPVVGMLRRKMWKHRQVAWLFHHLGIDASALLFNDEVDLEGLIMTRQLSILVVGQDVLKTNGKVGSQCTVLTDNYCEDAYNLLQAPSLKKLLLAGILLDTQNLNSAARFFTNRDAEAVQLLLVGSSPNYRYELFEQLIRDHKSNLFLEALKNSYGKPSSEDKEENEVPQESRLSTRKSTSVSPKEAKEPSSNKQENGISQESRRSGRKSTSVSSKESKVPSSTNHKISSTSSSASEPAKPPPASAPMKVQETTARGKNKNFFTKFFGFGK